MSALIPRPPHHATALSRCCRDNDGASSRRALLLPPTSKRRKAALILLPTRPQNQRANARAPAATAPLAAAPPSSSTTLHPPPSPEQFDEFEAAWLAERVPLSLGRTAAAWALRDVESGLLPCDARLLLGRARALLAPTSRLRHPHPHAYDGRALLQAHPAALALDADELRAGLERVMQLLPGAAREDPTGLAMAVLSPLVVTARGGNDNNAAAAERVALAHEELGAVVAASAQGLSMGPRLFAWLFDQQQQQQQQQQRQAPPLAAGLAALISALGGVELASAALERAPELALASDNAGELLARIDWLRYRLGIGGGGAGQEEEEEEEGRGGPSSSSSSRLLLLPARLAAALSTASAPDASSGRSIVSPARSSPRDPAGLPIRSPEALTRAEFAGAPAEPATTFSSPLAVARGPAALDARAAAAARLLRRRAGWPPGAAVRFLRAYPGAVAWDWSRGGACDRAFAEAAGAAARRGGRWPLALRTSPAAVAAALAAPSRARRRLAYLGQAPGALPGVGLRRALAMPEVDFLEACPGLRVWRMRRSRGGEEDEEEDEGGGGGGNRGPPPQADLVLFGELRPHDRML